MKKFRTIVSLVLCAALLCACGGKDHGDATTTGPAQQTTAPSGNAVYSVLVTDAAGDPVTSGVIVNFLSGGQIAAMQTVNDQGVAQKELPKGVYTVELGFTDASVSHHYDASDLTLTPDKTSLSVVLSQAVCEEYEMISAYSESAGDHLSYTAHYVLSGMTYIPMDDGDRTYVLFTPEQSGLYRFSAEGCTLGYYGSKHFVQMQSLSEVAEDGSFTVNVTPGMVSSDGTGTTVIVVGIDTDAEGCILKIERIGNAQLTIEDYPWTIYETTATLESYTLPENIRLVDFNLKSAADAYTLVLSTADGFYHLGTADGPLVYARLGCESAFLDSLETVLESSGLSRYYFDEAGNFLSKESYSECLLEYIQHMDPISGVYPLTQDLVYIFQNRGEYVGWWDASSSMYLFVDSNGTPIPGINTEIAWLFLCCYGEAVSVEPCADGHSEVTDAAVSATCTDSGLTEGKHCSVCGVVITAQQTVPATGHSYGAWVEVKAPTVDAAGLAERTCSACGSKQQQPLDKLTPEDACANGHTLVTDAGKAATCTSDGLTEGQHCGVCGTVTKLQQTISATGHSYGQWVEVKAPTYDEAGLSERTCASCGNKEQKELEKLERAVGTLSSADPVDIYYIHIEETMSFDAAVAAGEYAQYNLYWLMGMSITIESEDAYLIFGDKVYWPENGVIEFEIYYANPSDRYTPCTIYIGNCGRNDTTITAKLSTEPGTMMNPVKLNPGSFTTYLEAGNDQGYYYEFTATSSGTLTVTIDSISPSKNASLSLYNLSSYQMLQIDTTDGVSTISISVNAGDVVRVCLSAVPDSAFNYPALTLNCTAKFD